MFLGNRGQGKGICVAEPTGRVLEGFKVLFCAPVDPPHAYLALTSRRDEGSSYEFPNLSLRDRVDVT